MPDREFIHAREDVLEALRHAGILGLRVLPYAPRSDNAAEPLSEAEIEAADRGVYQLYKPEWVVEPLRVMQLDAGCDAGKYVVAQNVNAPMITVYFQGEGTLGGRRRLGAGGLDSNESGCTTVRMKCGLRRRRCHKCTMRSPNTCFRGAQ